MIHNKYNQDLLVDAEKISEDITFLENLNSTIQYQIKALQSLSAGSWDGFVAAFNSETQAVNSFNQAFSDQAITSQALGAAEAASLAEKSAAMAKNMNAACTVVNKTDDLVKATPNNVANMQNGLMALKNAQGALQAFQGLGQVLSAMGSEMASVHETLYANGQFLLRSIS